MTVHRHVSAARRDSAAPARRVVTTTATAGTVDGAHPTAAAAVDEMLALLPQLVAALRESGPHADARDRLPGPVLTPRQMTALVQLQLAGEQTMSDFAAGMSVSRATATEMIERLEERGLVARRHDEADRRLIVVRLSDAAATEAAAVVGRRRHDVQRALARFPDLPPHRLAGFMQELIDQLGSA